MRLLAIEPGLRLWGSERAFLDTVPALAGSYERVVIMTPPAAELIGALSGMPVEVVTAPIGNLHKAGRLARLRALASIVEACVRHRIDRIYLNQAGLCRIVHVAAQIVGRPLVIHARLFEDVPRCAALAATLRAPIDVVAISKAMLAHYRQHDEPHKRVLLAYDPFEIGAGPLDRRPPADRDFVCVGRIAAIKGQLEAVEAVGLVRDGGADVTLDLIGIAAPGDSYGDRVDARIGQRGLADAVRQWGYRTDAAALTANYRFAVIPSRAEPLGRVVMEAWNVGTLPIGSSDSGGAAEIVIASGGGLLYAGHEPSAIAATLAVAVALGERDRLAMVERGRSWAREKMSIDAYQRSLAGVLFPAADDAQPSPAPRILMT